MKIASLALAGLMLMAAGPGSLTITPGMWENTSTVTAVDAPGIPQQFVDMMKRTHTIRHCVTPEDAAKGAEHAMTDKNCTAERFNMSGGTYDVVMTCKSMTMKSHGTMTATSYQGTGDMTMERGPGGQGMHMTFTGSGKYLGPCT